MRTGFRVSTETLFLSDGKRWPNAEEYSSSLDIRAKHTSACMQQPPVHQLQRWEEREKKKKKNPNPGMYQDAELGDGRMHAVTVKNARCHEAIFNRFLPGCSPAPRLFFPLD
ncbi:hypothetical protein GQ607_008739 [Colletotrichum asianum]|uniref:Uncharacterized protein n=1 Tax=Colletotrichum asianum TaxID=702518 RepID=A0A8H3WBL9_9PEZI|nr:hypothetical protein GQ607_008739 [Colletotrichum asianum]